MQKFNYVLTDRILCTILVAGNFVFGREKVENYLIDKLKLTNLMKNAINF